MKFLRTFAGNLLRKR